MLFAGGYALPKDENVATQTITKHGGVTALGRVTIELLGGGGKQGSGAGGGIVSPENDEGAILEYWTLHNAWIKKIEFSELDYEGDDLSTVTVELRYDYAELNNTSVSPNHGTFDATGAREPDLPYGEAFGDPVTRQD